MPVYNNRAVFGQLASYLNSHGINTDDIFWTSIVKCADKPYAKSHKHCLQLMYQDIAAVKPRLVITVGKQVLETMFGEKNTLETRRVIKVDTLEALDHTSFFLHIYSLRDIAKFPAYSADNDFALSKIPAILRGEYPRNHLEGKAYYVVMREHELDAWMERYNNYEWLAFDIETGGTHPEFGLSINVNPFSQYSYVIGCSIAVYPGEAVFIDFRVLQPEVITRFIHWLKRFKLTMQNGKFDCNFIRSKYGISLYDSFKFDTMLADHLLRADDKRHNLKFLAAKNIPEFDGYEEPLTKFFKGTAKDKIDYGTLPPELLFPYGCMDADVQHRLTTVLSAELQQEGLSDFLADHVMRMQRSYAEREYWGWGIDRTAWETLNTEVRGIRDGEARVLSGFEEWNKYVYRTEADFRAASFAFWNPDTEEVYTDSQCLECAEPMVFNANGKSVQRKYKNGKRVIGNTYTKEDLIPDPSRANFKRKILFSEEFFGLTPHRITKKSKEPQVDQQTLREIKGKHNPKSPVVKFINSIEVLDTATKQLSTYITPVFPHLDKDGKWVNGWLSDDGIVHPSYMLAGNDFGSGWSEGGTTTGRISAARPNLTNIPTRKGGKKIKKMFVPAPRTCEGALYWDDPEPWVFIQLDYSQLELRMLGDQSGDEFILDAYRNDRDLHTDLASQQNDKSVEWLRERLDDDNHPEHDIAFNLRLCGKTSWFSVIYGAGPGNLRDTMAEYGLTISLDTAKGYVQELEQSLPGVAKMKIQVFNSAPTWITPFGRRRTVWDTLSFDPDIQASGHRALFNFGIQSPGSDLASTGIYMSDEWLREQKIEHGLRTYPVGAVHDSNILASPISELDYVASNVKRIMEHPQLPWAFRPRIKIDVEWGPNWGELIGWKPEGVVAA